MEVTCEGVGRNAAELVRKVKAAQYVRNHPGEVCPAKWEEGAETLAPGLDLVVKIYSPGGLRPANPPESNSFAKGPSRPFAGMPRADCARHTGSPFSAIRTPPPTAPPSHPRPDVYKRQAP